MFFLELTRVGPSLLAVLNSVVSKVDLQVSRDNKSPILVYDFVTSGIRFHQFWYMISPILANVHFHRFGQV